MVRALNTPISQNRLNSSRLMPVTRVNKFVSSCMITSFSDSSRFSVRYMNTGMRATSHIRRSFTSLRNPRFVFSSSLTGFEGFFPSRLAFLISSVVLIAALFVVFVVILLGMPLLFE
jgi:hypothetical protein